MQSSDPTDTTHKTLIDEGSAPAIQAADDPGLLADARPLGDEERVAVERAMLVLQIERLGDRMAAILGSEAPGPSPIGARAVASAALDTAWSGLAGAGLAALLVAIDPRLGLLGALLALLGWWWSWRAGTESGLAEGQAALRAFEQACPADHPLLEAHLWARIEREAIRPPAPEPGLSVEIGDRGGQLARLSIFGAGLLLPVIAATTGLSALTGPGVAGISLFSSLLVGGMVLALLVMIHDTDISMRATLLPGVARASAEGLLFSIRCQEFSDEMDAIDREARRLGMPLIRPERYVVED